MDPGTITLSTLGGTCLLPALLLVLHLYLPGWAWSWVLDRRESAPSGFWIDRLLLAAKSVVLGVVLSLFAALALAVFGVFTPALEWSAVVLLAVVGWGMSRGRGGPWTARAKRGWPGACLLGLGLAGVLALPNRGEWIVGGWDPGIYVNEGVLISRTASYVPPRDPFFGSLGEGELAAFTRPVHNYTEAYPGVPLDVETRSFRHLFFPLTPTLVAVAHRCGGLRAAARVNELAGWMTLLVLAAAAGALSGRRSQSVFAALALLVQPVWLYHLHVPVSEMLQLLLIGGVGLLLASPGGAVPLALLLMASEMNRFSFLPFAGIFLLAAAWVDLRRDDRRPVARERALQVTALVSGAAIDYALSPVTIGRLGSVVAFLLAIFAALVAAAVGLDLWAVGRERRASLLAWSERWGVPVGVAVLFAAVIVAFIPAAEPRDVILWNARHLVPCEGWAFLAAAAAGLATTLRAGAGEPRAKRAFVLFLAACATVTAIKLDIATLWPWASRRHLEFTVPLLAILAGSAGGFAWDRGGVWRRWGAALAALVVALNARTAWAAWSRTEFNGASRAIAEIAAQVGPDDIVVADHFRWGTPLRFLHGRNVVNGELFHAAGGRARFAAALGTLERLRREGRRIRFLTSTEEKLAIYPVDVGPATADWTSEPFVFSEIAHHPRARGFTLREKEKVFTLFTWQSGP